MVTGLRKLTVIGFQKHAFQIAEKCAAYLTANQPLMASTPSPPNFWTEDFAGKHPIGGGQLGQECAELVRGSWVIHRRSTDRFRPLCRISWPCKLCGAKIDFCPLFLTWFGT